MRARDRQSGVVLVNVLVVLAIAAGLMFLLIGVQETALDRTSRAADAAMAERIALGAEASVVAALYRDLAEAPEIDHLSEAWAREVIQSDVELATGRFSVSVTDLQAKFDINQLASLTVTSQTFATRLFASLDQPPEMVSRIVRLLGVLGPVEDLETLAAFGVPRATIDALTPVATALPPPGTAVGGNTVNLNTAPPELLAVMLQNPAQTSQLIRLRAARGYLTREDLDQANVMRPQNSDFLSDAYDVRITAEAGDSRVVLRSQIIRSDRLGARSVRVRKRRFLQE